MGNEERQLKEKVGKKTEIEWGRQGNVEGSIGKMMSDVKMMDDDS